MEGLEAAVTFEDFGWLDPVFIREVLWKDLGKQHRLPEEYRIGLRTWAAAISHAPLAVANRLTINAPEELRVKLGSLVIYEKPTREEAVAAQRLITELYGPDLMRHTRFAFAVREESRVYGKPTASKLPEVLDLHDVALLDTRGVEAAEQFAGAANPAYGLVSDLAALRSVYRLMMEHESDALRAALGTPSQVALPTGRVHVVRARASDLLQAEAGSEALLELSRVLSTDGCLAVEDEPEEIARVVAKHPRFERRSQVIAVLARE
ncbi:MAG: hypothetical protein AMXMBFR61_16500 [Fimbriimonadales bacterium]